MVSTTSLPDLDGELEGGTVSEAGPTAADLKRLEKLWREQGQRLTTLKARTNLITSREQKIQRQVQQDRISAQRIQEKRQQRRNQELDRRRMEEDTASRQQYLRERNYHQREIAKLRREVPRQRKLEESQAAAEIAREEKRQMALILERRRESEKVKKLYAADARRQEVLEAKVEKELRLARLESSRQESVEERFAALQEEIRNTEANIGLAEQQELTALKRLQDSQMVHAEVVGHLRGFQDESVEEVYP